MIVNSKAGYQWILDYFKANQTRILTDKIHQTNTDTPLTFEHLCGDMSYKQFYRVKTFEQNFILIIIPTKGAASIEIFNAAHQLQLCPMEAFYQSTENLSYHLDYVSVVHGVDKTAGLILLDDHGDLLLEDHLKNQSQKKILRSFAEIFHHLQAFQALETQLPKDFFALKRTFETQALLAELKEYLKYGKKIHEACILSAKDNLEIICEYEVLCQQIYAQPKTLIHRDFQSKNILVEKHKLWVIDYQDLCMGAYTYDYASIIFDPYLDLPLNLQILLIKLSWQMNFRKKIPYYVFEKDILVTAQQRLLKAAGRYAKHLHLYGKSLHMQYYDKALQKFDELNNQCRLG